MAEKIIVIKGHSSFTNLLTLNIEKLENRKFISKLKFVAESHHFASRPNRWFGKWVKYIDGTMEVICALSANGMNKVKLNKSKRRI